MDKALSRNAPEHVQRPQRLVHRTGKIKNDALRFGSSGGVDQSFDDQRRAVVHVHGIGKVKDGDLVLLNIRTYQPGKLVGGGEGKFAAQIDQAHPGLKLIDIVRVGVAWEKLTIEQRH